MCQIFGPVAHNRLVFFRMNYIHLSQYNFHMWFVNWKSCNTSSPNMAWRDLGLYLKVFYNSHKSKIGRLSQSWQQNVALLPFLVFVFNYFNNSFCFIHEKLFMKSATITLTCCCSGTLQNFTGRKWFCEWSVDGGCVSIKHSQCTHLNYHHDLV